MINAAIEYKEKTVVVDLSGGLSSLALQLRSIGIKTPPNQIRLTDNEEDALRVKLYGQDEVASHLALLLTEAHSLEDAAVLDHVVSTADERLQEELTKRIKAGEYGSPNELYEDLSNMLRNVWIYGAARAVPVEEVFYFPLIGEIDEGEEGFPECSPATEFEIMNYRRSIRSELEDLQNNYEGNMAKLFRGSESLRKKLVSAVWDVEAKGCTLYGKVTMQTNAPLTEDEREELRTWISDQNEQGLGKWFEQRPIDTKEGPLTISLWNGGPDYFVHTAEDMDHYLSHGMEMGGMA